MQKHNGKYSQKLLHSATKSAIDAIKTASKREIKKPAETTEDLIGNKVADKITSTSKKSLTELHYKELPLNESNNGIQKERYISPQERQQIIDELIIDELIMEYQKIANLIDDVSHQHLNLEQKIGLKYMMNQGEHTMLIAKSNLKLHC